MAHIDYYLFPLSPFTYLAGDGLERIATKHNASITYKPFALLKVFEETGTLPPAKRHPSRQEHRLQEIRRIATRNKLPVTLKPAHWPTNPVPSCYAIIAAQEAGGGDLGGLCQSILRAVWAEDKDIAQDEVIKAALSENGFDPALSDSAMVTSAQVFESNTEDAMRANVFGAPSYVIDDQIFWGQDRLDYLDDYLGTVN